MNRHSIERIQITQTIKQSLKKKAPLADAFFVCGGCFCALHSHQGSLPILKERLELLMLPKPARAAIDDLVQTLITATSRGGSQTRSGAAE